MSVKSPRILNEKKKINMANTGISLRIEPFNTDSDRANLSEKWKSWLEIFEDELYLQRVTDDIDKIICLKRYAGKEIRLIIKYLPNTENNGKDSYEEVKKKLNHHFIPKQNKQHARFIFNKMRQEHEESISQYAMRLREQAETCDFENNREERILEHLIQTIDDNELITRAIQKQWNLNTFLEEASQRNDLKREVKEITKTHLKTIDNENWTDRVNAIGRKQPTGWTGKKKQINCRYCGGLHKFDKRQNCPAYGQVCYSCGKMNHYGGCCIHRQQGGVNQNERQLNRRQDNTPRNIRRVEREADTSSEDEEFIRKMNIKIHKIKTIKKCNNIVEIRIGDVDTYCEPDSGASANVMDEYQFKALKRRTHVGELKPNYDRVKTIQGSCQ